MKQIAQHYKTGTLSLVDVPPPALQRGMLLVRNVCSAVSCGTEGSKVSEARMNLLQKAVARPDQLRQVLQTAKQQGIDAAYRKAMHKLDALSPLGYSASGVVEAVGEGVTGFQVGQRVAIAGAGYANHAQLNAVPQLLCASVPEGVQMHHAAFTTLGCIALHALRQSETKIGEVVVVIGLGMVGQLIGQMAQAAGAVVIGIDPDAARCALALQCGFAAAASPEDAAIEQTLTRISNGLGADAVFLALGTQSNQPLQNAITLVRERGRVVCVGMAKMDVPYSAAFKKEIEFRFSRSYGPGRYDPVYEEGGNDYPPDYVRWSEGRNMQAVLGLMAQGKLRIDALITHRLSFEKAPEMYDAIAADNFNGLGVVFDYAQQAQSNPSLRIATGGAPKADGQLGIGCIGAGNYAASMLLPQLKAAAQASLVEVANATALSGRSIADKFGFARCSSDAKGLIEAEDIDAVFIATRHDSHAQLAQQALAAGKAVWVEKPLAIRSKELTALEEALHIMQSPRLHVGFNRRFAPIMQDLKAQLPKDTPLSMFYRVQAGPLDAKHWLRDSQQGGRFIGEAGHFFDVFAFLTDASPVSVTAQRIAADDDNLIATVRYSDGSVATLQYLTNGAQSLPKEWLEVAGGGVTLQMHHFKELHSFSGAGSKPKIKRGYGANKGQKEQMQAVLDAWSTSEAEMPIALASLLETSWLTLAAVQAAADNSVMVLGRDA